MATFGRWRAVGHVILMTTDDVVRIVLFQSLNFPFMSQSLFNEDGTVYNQTLILTNGRYVLAAEAAACLLTNWAFSPALTRPSMRLL